MAPLLQPPAAMPADDADQPCPRWVLEAVRESYRLLSTFDPAARDVDRAASILRQVFIDISR